jgi:3-hydroxymyristoyl/3-hydroxydecanoyl-(acyl carrier protein) dehydratase
MEAATTQNMEVHGRTERPNGLTLECRVPTNLKFLEGHFRGNPVVAGVVQVYWVMAEIRALLGGYPKFAGLEALKFHHLLLPGQEFQLAIDRGSAGKWNFRLQSGDKKISSGRLLIEDPKIP